MSGKKPSIKVVVMGPGSKNGRSESFVTENTTKTLYKSHGGGCSSKIFQSHMAVIPAPSSSSSSKVLSVGSKKGRSESFMTENTTKTYKNHGGGCSSKTSQSHKAAVFVDNRNGNQGIKKETKYTSSVKVNDKAKGCTTEYETQVMCKKVTTYNNDSSKRARGHATAAGSKSSSSNKSINIFF